MTEAEQRQRATDFSNYWRNKGDEKSEAINIKMNCS